MGNSHSSIKIECILIIESKEKNIFPILCKYINVIELNGLTCNYHMNKEMKSNRSTCNIHKEISKANFIADKFSDVEKLWETLKTWMILTENKFSFTIYTKRDGISYGEYKNEEYIRYEFERVPSYFKIYFP